MFDAALATAFLSFMATVFAAYATWRGPINAARIAENLRASSERQSEARKLKSLIFYSLMQERSTLYSIEGVRALNLIDVAFIDNSEVRECWIELHASFNLANQLPQFAQTERLKNLLKAIAKDINLSDRLNSDDLSRVYYPNAIAQAELIKNMEREAAIARLQGQPASTNASDTQAGMFPPRPTA